MKNYLLLFEDTQITIFEDTYEDKIFLENGLIKDGEIVDFNYLYYLIKKQTENIKRNSKISFIITSSKFTAFDINIAGIKKDELDSFIYYEIQKLLPTSIKNFAYSYENMENTVKVRIVEKNIIEAYKSLAQNLKINLNGIYYISDTLKIGDYINYSINHMQIIDAFDDNMFYFSDFSNFLEKNALNSKDLDDILQGEFSTNDVDALESLRGKIEYFQSERDSWLNKYINKEKSYTYFGDFTIKNLSNSIFHKKLSYADFKLKNNFIEQKNNKKIFITSILLIIIFIFGNFYIYNGLKNHELIAQENYEKMLSESKINKNNSTKKPQKVGEEVNSKSYEKNFEDLVVRFENFSNDDILFKEYNFVGNKVIIKGISNSSELLNEATNFFKNTKILSTQIIDNDLYFEIEVALEELNENR